jgi:hypothetical protein
MRCIMAPADRRRFVISLSELLFGVAALMVAVVAGTAAAAGPDFQREIQPILAEHCAHCHGIDEETRQGGLRLDIRQHALDGGDSAEPAIVPGKPEASLMVARIHATDPDVIMPPPHEKKPLSAAQKKLLEDWIAAGAGYDPHWAFLAPQKAVVPAAAEAKTPIDAFVRSHLASKQLEPAPAADAATTLCRRRPQISPHMSGTDTRRRWRNCWPALATARSGRDTGSTSPATPIPTATKRISPATCGPGGIG